MRQEKCTLDIPISIEEDVIQGAVENEKEVWILIQAIKDMCKRLTL